MKANELRQGNYVCEFNEPDNPAFQQTVIGIGIQASDDIWVSNGDVYKADEIYPIPLTEDWLIRFGFEIRDDSERKYFFGYIDLDKSFQPIDSELNNVCLYEIQYVHQLQNIYFALTG